MRLTQIEAEHYQFLLKCSRDAPAGRALPPPRLTGSGAPRGDAERERRRRRPPADSGRPRAHAKLATITGRVEVKGKPWGPIYVYVENVKEAPVDRSVEIMQKDRSFVPNVAGRAEGNARHVPQRGSVPAQRVFTVPDAAVRPRQLPARRQGRRGQVVQAGRRRGAV